MINVLHVLDIAGVSSILSYFHNKYGYGPSDIIFHKKITFHITYQHFMVENPSENIEI